MIQRRFANLTLTVPVHAYEKPLELSLLREQNFLRYEGKGEAYCKIHSYPSLNFRELRNMAKDNPALVAKAKAHLYVPRSERDREPGKAA